MLRTPHHHANQAELSKQPALLLEFKLQLSRIYKAAVVGFVITADLAESSGRHVQILHAMFPR